MEIIIVVAILKIDVDDSKKFLKTSCIYFYIYGILKKYSHFKIIEAIIKLNPCGSLPNTIVLGTSILVNRQVQRPQLFIIRVPTST